MANFERGFNFDMDSLGRNLATFDHDVERYIDRAKEEAAIRGEADLKLEAPWSDRTGNARRGLWAEPYGTAKDGGIRMGHGVEYGVYLEKANNGRFQVIMPVLLKTARALMRSFEYMFEQMDSPVPIAPILIPSGGLEQGTSQGARVRAAHEKNVIKRQVKRVFGRAKNIFGTARTRRTRRG